MPANMTWWQAAVYAKAGIPVRRESVDDPLAWFVRETPGLFHRYEEENSEIGSPAPADATHTVVIATQFTATEFDATDWTTFGVPAGEDVDPPAGEVTPPGRVPPGYPPKPPGVTPPAPVVPPALPRYPEPSPVPAAGVPHWDLMSAGILSDPYRVSAAGSLIGTVAGQTWVCTARVSLEGGGAAVVNLGTTTTGGDHALTGSVAANPPPFGRIIVFQAECTAGSSDLVGGLVIGSATIPGD